MSKILSLIELIEDLRKYFSEKENKDTNIFLFIDNKFSTQEFSSGLLFKNINFLRILLLFFLNIFLIILLVIHTTKYEKDKNDQLTTILLLISLLLSITIFSVFLRFLKSARIKKKNLLYLLYAFNFIISCLIFYFNISNQNLVLKRNLIYSQSFYENFFDKSLVLEIHRNKKINESDKIFTYYNLSNSIINETDTLIHFKFLQIEYKNQTLNNLTSQTQINKKNNDQEKIEIYIIFNLAQFLLFFFICLGEKRIFIFSFVFNFIVNIILYSMGFIVNLNFLFFLLITDIIMLLVFGFNQILLNFLVEYINLHFFEIINLLEYFLSLFAKFGIFYNFLIHDNNIKNEKIDIYKSIFQIQKENFQTLRKTMTFKETATRNIKYNEKKSKNKQKGFEDIINNQTNHYLINEISPSSLKLSEENLHNENSIKIKQFSKDLLNIGNKINTKITEKTDNCKKCQNKILNSFDKSNKLNYETEITLSKDVIIKKQNNEFDNPKQRKMNFDHQQLDIKNPFNEKNFSNRRIINNFDEKKNDANIQINQQKISSNFKNNSETTIEAININDNNFLREEESFYPYLLISNFYEDGKYNSQNSNNSNSSQIEIFKVEEFIKSNLKLDKKTNMQLKDLIKFNFEKFVPKYEYKPEEIKTSSNLTYNVQRYKFSENSLKPFSSNFNFYNSDENEFTKKKFSQNYINNDQNSQIYNGTNESYFYNFPIENWVNNSDQNINIFHNNLKSPEMKMKNPVKVIENTSDKIPSIKITSNPLSNKNLTFSSHTKKPIQVNYKNNNINISSNLKNNQLWENQNNESNTSMNILEESLMVSEFINENKDNLNDNINTKHINSSYNRTNLTDLNNKNEINCRDLNNSKDNCNFTLDYKNKIIERKNANLFEDSDLECNESISNDKVLKNSLYCKVKNEHNDTITPRIKKSVYNIDNKFATNMDLKKSHRWLFLKKKSFSASPLKTLYDNKNINIKNSMIEGHIQLNNNYLIKKTRTIDSQHLNKINSMKQSGIFKKKFKLGYVNLNKKLYNSNLNEKHLFLDNPNLKGDEEKFCMRQFKSSDSYRSNDLESWNEENFEIKTKNLHKSQSNKNSLTSKNNSIDRNINFISNNTYLNDKKNTDLIDPNFIRNNPHLMNEETFNKSFKNNFNKRNNVESIKENEYFNFTHVKNNYIENKIKNIYKDTDKKDKANFNNNKEYVNWDEEKNQRIYNPLKYLFFNIKDNKITLHEILKKLIHTKDKSKILKLHFLIKLFIRFS